MRRLLLLLALLTIVVSTALLPSAGAVFTSPVLCESYPNEPWRCAPLDGSMTDWGYLYGLNSPTPDTFDQSTTWDAAGETSTNSGINDATSSRSGFGTQYCRVTAYIRRVYAGGRYWTRGTGDGICRLNGTPIPRTWVMTVCLTKSSNMWFGYSVVHCHTKSAVTTNIRHKIYHSCRSTAGTYWRAEAVAFSSQPYWTSTKNVTITYPSYFPCG